MIEGWIDNNYLVLFSGEEIDDRSHRYQIGNYLPEYRVIGLKGWDDFIVLGVDGSTFTVPTIPLTGKYLQPVQPPPSEALKHDTRFVGHIKWYITPLVFGGSADDKHNVEWLTHEQHIQAVRWWNAKYRELLTQEGERE